MKPRISPPGNARLFSDAQVSGPPAGVHIANIDGASRGNPGPAAYAVVLRDPDGKIVLELGKKIGRETNNVAEYYALLAALDYAMNQGIRALRIRSDSELLVRQLQGRYKVKSPDLKPLYERALKMARQLTYFAVEHVRREYNTEADGLANVALDSGNVSHAAARTPVLNSPAGETHFTSGEAAGIPANHGRPSAQPIPPGAAPAAPAIVREHPIVVIPPSSRSAPRSFSRISVRARVVRGALVPVQPLNVAEGTEVEVDLLVPRSEGPPDD